MNMIFPIRKLFAQIVDDDYFSILALILAVQGTVLASQAIAALFISIELLGAIRTFESVFAVLVLIAGFRAPALAVREFALRENTNNHALLLRDLTLFPLVGAVLAALLSIGLILAGFKLEEGPGQVIALGLLLLISVNLTRLAAAVAQGLQSVGRVYRAAIGGACGCAVIQVLGAATGHVEGWIAGRLIGEILLLSIIVIFNRAHFPSPQWFAKLDVRSLFTKLAQATSLNFGLIVRMAVDAAPIALLNIVASWQIALSLRGDRDLLVDIGHFGLATLAMTAAMMPLSVISQRQQPILTAAAANDRRRLELELRKRMIWTSIAVSIPLMALALLVHFLSFRQISMAMLPAAALFMLVPAKSVALAQAGILMSYGRYKAILAVNVVELLVTIIYVLFNYELATKWTGVEAIAVGSVVSLFGLHLFRPHR